MHATIDGIDAVGEGKFGGGPAIVVLYGQLDFDVVYLANGADRASLYTTTVLVQVAHKGDQTPLEVEGRLTVSAFITQGDGQAPIEIGHLAETLSQDVKTEVAGR